MLSMLTAASYLLIAPFDIDRTDGAVLTTAGAAMVWALLLAPGRPLFQPHAYGPVLAFSACALGLSLAFISSAVRRDRFDHLCFGVLFAIAFLFVRWLSIIGNMAWSALLMLVTGAALLLIARAWRSRDHLAQPSAIPGRPS